MRSTRQVKRAKSEPGGTFLATSAAGLYVQFGVQLVVGVLLNTRYRPTIEGAHASVAAIRQEAFPRFLADLHYWGGALLVLTAALHVVAMLWLGWYQKPHTLRWVTSLAFLAGSLGLQITGNLLPMARHDVQTVVIEGGIAARMPIVGSMSRELILQGSQFGQPTLEAWHLAHTILLPVFISVMAVAAFFGHRAMKDVQENRALMLLPLLATIALALYVPAPFGKAASQADFQAFDAMVGWYVWPLHGVLKLAESIRPDLAWVGMAVIPGLFVGFLASLPVVKPKLATARLGLFTFGAIFLGASLGFGGKPAPIVGDQDPKEVVLDAPKAEVKPIDPVLATEGRGLFAEQGCNGCHGTDGKKGEGGPDLSTLYKKRTDAAWLVEFIRDPKSKKPQSTMPGYPDLPEPKLRALAEFLRDPIMAGANPPAESD